LAARHDTPRDNARDGQPIAVATAGWSPAASGIEGGHSMSTDWETTWDAEQEGSSSALKQLLPLIAVVLLLVGLGAWQAQRRRARKPRGIQRIVAAVNESELSEQAKQVLRDSVDEVSGMLATLRSSASELTAR
jgi:hypothetical protein